MRSVGRGRWLRIATAGLSAVVVFVAVVVFGGSGEASEAQAEPDPRLEDPSVYPTRGFHDIKGIAPDGWSAGQLPGLGTVGVNFAWDLWEPTVELPPCSADRVEYDGRCFVVPQPFDRETREFTEAGVHVTGVFWGTPGWARGERRCVPFLPQLVRFCVPDDPEDLARFVGFIAERYNGASGHGRVVDFVIQNEVNTSMWFNTGCGSGVACDLDSWIADYAAIYNRSYDRIRAAQPQARVMFSFTNLFGAELDEPTGSFPSYSIQSFLPRLVAQVGDREWSVALHPYATNLAARIDARDYPYATLGSVGVLPGWLRATYPDDPHAWEVQLTESGFHNVPETSDAVNQTLCDSFRNVLGTPGITSYIYHRLRDQPGEQGLLLGLVDLAGNPKPALGIWLHANGLANPACGFELDGHTVVRQGVQPGTGARWYSSRVLPSGYEPQATAWPLSWSERPGTTLLFECANSGVDATWLWNRPDCDGGIPMGPVGWVDTTPGDGRAAMLACVGQGPYGRTVTTAASCPPGRTQTLLGYVDADVEEPPTTTTTTTPTPTTTVPPGPDPREDDLMLRLDTARGSAGDSVGGTVDVDRVSAHCADTVPEVQANFREFRQAVESLAGEFGGAGQLLPPYQNQTHAAYSMLWALGVGVGSDRGYAELALEQTHVMAVVEDTGNLTTLRPLGALGGFNPVTGRGQVMVPDIEPGEWPVLAACVSPSTDADALRQAVAKAAEVLDRIGFDPTAAQGPEFLTFLQEIAPDLLLHAVEVDAWSKQTFCVSRPDHTCPESPTTTSTTSTTTPPPGDRPQDPPPATPVPGRPNVTG